MPRTTATNRLNIGRLLSKDFNDGTIQGYSSGSNVGNKLRVTDWDTSVYYPIQFNEDVIYKAKVTPISVSGAEQWRSARLAVRYQDDSNYYFLQILPNDNTMQIWRRVLATETLIATSGAISVSLGTAYEIEWKITGNGGNTKHTITVDGVEIISETTDAGNTVLNKGYFGFRNNGAVADFDDVTLDLVTTPTRTAIINNQKSLDIAGDGVDDYAQLTPNSKITDIEGTQAITIDIIIKFNQLSSAKGSGQIFIKKGHSVAPWQSWYMQMGSDDKIYFAIVNASSSEVSAVSNNALETDKWYHIVGRYDGTNIKLTIDNVAQTNQAQTGNIFVSDLWLRLSDTALVRSFKGLLDNVRLYNRVLTDAEISDRFNYCKDIRDGLVAEWDFNEGSGTVAIDITSGKNHFTLNGSVSFSSDIFRTGRKLASPRTAV